MIQTGFGRTSALEGFEQPFDPAQAIDLESPLTSTDTSVENTTRNAGALWPSSQPLSPWERFCRWVTSTENRIYIGWFGMLAIPTLATAAIVFVLAIIAAPAVDMDGTGRMVSGSLLDGNNLITAAVVPTSAAIGLHFYPIWEAASLDEWLINGGPYQLIVLHFIIGIISYQDREWELSYRLKMRPWISLAFTAPVAASVSVLLVYPVGQGGFASGMPLGISGTFTFMMQFQADHNILASPLHQMGVIGVLGGALLCAVHGSLVTSTVCRAPAQTMALTTTKTGTDRQKPKKAKTYSFEHAQAYQQTLLWRGAKFNSSRAVHFCLAALPVAGIWSAAIGVDLAAFDFDRLSFELPSHISVRKTVVPTWSDVVNQANLGIHTVGEKTPPKFSESGFPEFKLSEFVEPIAEDSASTLLSPHS
ncbi:Photosynthetic reaction center protein [Synechococcus sp. PCC 7335]|uniref:Light-dependent chlorophyll f synthase n=1 Tax=Synechococcus sp. (strain ATCC 29403 / PCC 7335) TaxID=91464 RepID=CHLF_SYNS7|nr:photosystem I reaction center subunit IX [Synechococcus sp. PCC 7335]B4WP19.1 RecName: Full=Light-dependent chlorophyll f synthase; Short=Chl f synthase; AltName: Full=Super-rogue D1; AltName: Full=Super-rogue PsbA4; Short=Sr-PsbA4 [Synechococcus sp. PCC 7335]EDX86548.1 Photosynthetic reaction center protein [Synechococcus sp. PCC 7335]